MEDLHNVRCPEYLHQEPYHHENVSRAMDENVQDTGEVERYRLVRQLTTLRVHLPRCIMNPAN